MKQSTTKVRRSRLRLVKGRDVAPLQPKLCGTDAMIQSFRWMNRLNSLLVHNVPADDWYDVVSELVSVVARHTDRASLRIATDG